MITTLTNDPDSIIAHAVELADSLVAVLTFGDDCAPVRSRAVALLIEHSAYVDPAEVFPTIPEFQALRRAHS